MENKTDIDTVLKRPYKLCVFIAYNKIKNEEFCTSFVTFYVPVPTFNEGPSSNIRLFNNFAWSTPLSWNDTSLLMNLLFKLLLLKGLTCEND